MDQLPAVCLLLLVLQGGAQREPSCSVEIREPPESALTRQRIQLGCHLQGQWQGLTCTLNGEMNRIHISVGTYKCQLDIMARREGTNLVQCTVFCIDGSTNSTTINMTVIGTSTPAPSPTSSVLTVHTSSTDTLQSTATPTHPTDKDRLQPEDSNDSVPLRVIVPVCVGGVLVLVAAVAVVVIGVEVYKRNTARRKRTTPQTLHCV